MKMMKKIMLRIVIICFLIAGAQLQLQAQPGDPGIDPDKIPLDPGTWVLVAAGVGYGVKKWRDARVQKLKSTQGEDENLK